MRDARRALNTLGREIWIRISWLDLFLGVSDEYDGRDRARESREVSEDDDRAEDGEERRKNYNCPESGAWFGCLFHYAYAGTGVRYQ